MITDYRISAVDPVYQRIRNLHPDIVECERFGIDDITQTYRWRFADGSVEIQKVTLWQVQKAIDESRETVNGFTQQQIEDAGLERWQLRQAYREKVLVNLFDQFIRAKRISPAPASSEQETRE